MSNSRGVFAITLCLHLSFLVSTQDQECYPACPECFELGECMDSLLLDSLHEIEDAQSCLERCQQDNDCEYFTFYEEYEECLTFANCVTFTTDSCTKCYSGDKSCEGLECWVDGLCQGVLIRETIGLSRNDCLQECQTNEECLWFTHDSEGDVCLMFENCDELDTSCKTCISSQEQCSPFVEPIKPELTKLIVIGGANYDQYLSSVEVIDLENSSSNCSSIADYPYEESDMVVGIIDGLIKTCGGDGYGTQSCFEYHPATNRWTGSPDMLYSRSNPRSSYIDGIWLISGDHDLQGQTEMWTGSEFEEGPIMPEDMYAHCQLTVNTTHIFFADTISERTSYLYAWNLGISGTWFELPQMSLDTELASCGLINNPVNGKEVVIVEHGTSEIFNFNTLTWRTGPSVAYFTNAGFTQLTDTFVVVGGHDDADEPLDTIYQFDHINYEWILVPQRLQIARQEHPGTIAVPDDFITCN